MKNLSPISFTLPKWNISISDSLCDDMGFLVMEEEVWKDIEGFEGRYQVSNLGRVKSLSRVIVKKNNRNVVTSEIILKAGVTKNGYFLVNISIYGKCKSFLVHRLVAVAFLDHIPNGMKTVIDHINYNKLDNRAINLQLVSNRENLSKDRFRQGYSSKHVGVNWSKANKKWRAAIQINNKSYYLGYFDNELDASNAYQDALKKHMSNEAII
jgi:hypothetical protein